MVLLVLLVLWPLAELYVIIKISEAIGFLWMLLLLVLSWPVGLQIVRHEGRAAVRRLREAVAAGRTPTTEVLDGALVLIGGLLLLVPGFITDAVGLLLLLYPTRALARRIAAHNPYSAWLDRSLGVVFWGVRGGHRGRGGRGPGAGGHDVESTAVDIDERQLER